MILCSNYINSNSVFKTVSHDIFRDFFLPIPRNSRAPVHCQHWPARSCDAALELALRLFGIRARSASSNTGKGRRPVTDMAVRRQPEFTALSARKRFRQDKLLLAEGRFPENRASRHVRGCVKSAANFESNSQRRVSRWLV